MNKRIPAAVAAAVLSFGALSVGAAPASASDRGGRHDYRSDSKREDLYRGLTYGLGAVTAYGAIKRDPLIAGAGALGGLYTYSQWKDAEGDRHRDEWGHGRGYGYGGYRRGYDYGRGYDHGRDYGYGHRDRR